MTTATVDLALVRSVMKSITGMDLSGIRDQQLERRVTSFCQRRSIPGTVELVAAIRADDRLLAEFVDRLTINVTNLYRNPERWRHLEERVLPLLGPRPRIWSAGCSTGAEAYSLAIASLRTGGTPNVLGSDIDRTSLEKARTARYGTEDMREVPAEIERRWFHREGSDWVVSPAVTRLVRFERRDLLHDTPPGASFELVACRNVVIYFNDQAKERLHATLAGALTVGGYLFVGNAERITRPAELGLVPAGPQFYRKASDIEH